MKWQKEGRGLTLKTKIGFVLMAFVVFISGTAHGNITEYAPPPKFGKGPVLVRLYSDYFCGPCRGMSPEIEPVLVNLVNRDIITLMFIDSPFHKESTMYARYFLYAMHAKCDIAAALVARKALFSAAGSNILDKDRLEEFLKKSGVNFVAFDARPAFNVFAQNIQKDKISSTPTSVIERNGKKKVYTGQMAIAEALSRITQ